MQWFGKVLWRSDVIIKVRARMRDGRSDLTFSLHVAHVLHVNVQMPIINELRAYTVEFAVFLLELYH